MIRLVTAQKIFIKSRVTLNKKYLLQMVKDHCPLIGKAARSNDGITKDF